MGIAVLTGASEAARQTGIPERTIAQWVESKEFAELRERKKEEVAEEWWAGVQTAARSIIKDIDSASVRDRAVAFGILVEKMLLVRGDATVRTESRSLTDDLNDHEGEILGAIVRDELARRKDQDAPEPAVESAPKT